MYIKMINFLIIIFLPTVIIYANNNANRADTLYMMCQDSIYQIQVIDIISGKKAAIGTAFGVDSNGLLATNYHVISEVIHNPNLYRLECVGRHGKTASLKIVDIDIVHDLAIVLHEHGPTKNLTLSETPIKKGNTLFVIGNPLDLGMGIVEGTYNGLVEKSFHEKALFSGSVNPGMSGGPAINHAGEVVGITVAEVEKQVSFLVPVKYLKELLSRIGNDDSDTDVDLHSRIEEQLLDNQKQLISHLMAAEWTLDSLGAARIPKIEADILNWWGDTETEEDILYEHSYSTCINREQIFISPSFSTGIIVYSCDWYVSKELNAPRLYNLLETVFGETLTLNIVAKNDVTEFENHTSFVKIAERDWRVTFCSRNYKKYPHLYDVVVKMASIAEVDRALLIDVVLSGVSEESALAFVKKFMETISWQN